jgi:hypothetical protein
MMLFNENHRHSSVDLGDELVRLTGYDCCRCATTPQSRDLSNLPRDRQRRTARPFLPIEYGILPPTTFFLEMCSTLILACIVYWQARQMAWRWRDLSVGLYVPLLEFNLEDRSKPSYRKPDRSSASQLVSIAVKS